MGGLGGAGGGDLLSLCVGALSRSAALLHHCQGLLRPSPLPFDLLRRRLRRSELFSEFRGLLAALLKPRRFGLQPCIGRLGARQPTSVPHMPSGSVAREGPHLERTLQLDLLFATRGLVPAWPRSVLDIS